MNVKTNAPEVNKCSRPSFMGHEELALPMDLHSDALPPGAECPLGVLQPMLADHLRPNDMSDTAVSGYMAGCGAKGVDLETIFIGEDPGRWTRAPAIVSQLHDLGLRYAFFMERSAAPLQDGYIHRCRFISRGKLHDFFPGADLDAETAQEVAAPDVLAAFLGRVGIGIMCYEEGVEKCYGDYYRSRERSERYGDTEQYAIGYAIWLEQEGVIRAWTRVTYSPQ